MTQKRARDMFGHSRSGGGGGSASGSFGRDVGDSVEAVVCGIEDFVDEFLEDLRFRWCRACIDMLAVARESLNWGRRRVYVSKEIVVSTTSANFCGA